MIQPISFEAKRNNHNLEEYFGEEEADTFIDQKETEAEVLGDYNIAKFLYEEDED